MATSPGISSEAENECLSIKISSTWLDLWPWQHLISIIIQLLHQEESEDRHGLFCPPAPSPPRPRLTPALCCPALFAETLPQKTNGVLFPLPPCAGVFVVLLCKPQNRPWHWGRNHPGVARHPLGVSLCLRETRKLKKWLKKKEEEEKKREWFKNISLAHRWSHQ